MERSGSGHSLTHHLVSVYIQCNFMWINIHTGKHTRVCWYTVLSGSIDVYYSTLLSNTTHTHIYRNVKLHLHLFTPIPSTSTTNYSPFYHQLIFASIHSTLPQFRIHTSFALLYIFRCLVFVSVFYFVLPSMHIEAHHLTPIDSCPLRLSGSII